MSSIETNPISQSSTPGDLITSDDPGLSDEGIDSVEVNKDVDPWSTLEIPAPSARGITTSLAPKPSNDEEREIQYRRDRYRAQEERREKLTEAKLSVTLDRNTFSHLADEIPESKVGSGNIFASDEEKLRIQTERRTDLQRTIEAISKLPERLDFKPGITLIVGENGMGKSTLAKALRYAAMYKERAEEYGQESAERMTYNPRDDDKVELHQAGLAPDISRHIHIDELEHGAPGFRYYDTGVILGELRHLERELGRGDYRYDEHGNSVSTQGSFYDDGRSHRQTVDDRLFGIIKGETERQKAKLAGQDRHGSDNGRTQIYFIDEPETGMSPRRHKQLAKELMDITADGSILIIPTNSIVLFDSDLPRIDLEHPERGIFVPDQSTPDQSERSQEQLN